MAISNMNRTKQELASIVASALIVLGVIKIAQDIFGVLKEPGFLPYLLMLAVIIYNVVGLINKRNRRRKEIKRSTSG